MLRVVVVDDSPTSRKLVAEILAADPEIRVIGEASHGAEAVQSAVQLRPDLIVMDAHMPNMDGFTATEEIMILAPMPIVILTASTSPSDLQTAMRALRAGALTLLQKPISPIHPDFDEHAEQLIATVKAMAAVKVVRHHRRPTRSPAVNVLQPARVRPKAVAIASSTGGPVALQRLLSGLPPDFPIPILVVQHISHGFTDAFATWLQSVAPMRVKVAEPQEPLVGKTVYIAPENQHLMVTAPGVVQLSDAPLCDGFRPSGSPLFESVAHIYGSASVAVILTGMGRDGIEGLRAVQKAKGLILAQNEDSCVVYGMPGAAVAAGLPDAVLPLESISQRLMEVVS